MKGPSTMLSSSWRRSVAGVGSPRRTRSWSASAVAACCPQDSANSTASHKMVRARVTSPRTAAVQARRA